MALTLSNQNSAWTVYENVKERRHETHIPDDAGADALEVTRNTGTLGDGGAALSVAAGDGVVAGSRFSKTGQSVDIAQGDTRPRRDLVYLGDDGAIDVLRGVPAAYAWGKGVADTQQTVANAFLPAPRSLADVPGLALAIVTVPGGGATSLDSGEHVIDGEVRVRQRPLHAGLSRSTVAKPTVDAEGELSVDGAIVQASLDGRVVPVGEGLGSGDAVDPAATATPVQDAYNIAKNAGGQRAVLLPASTVHEDETINANAKNCSILGWGNRSVINYDGASGETILSITNGAASDFLGFQVYGVGDNVSASAPAIHVDSRSSPLFTDNRLGDIWILNHHGQAIKADGGLFACEFGPFRVGQVDAGDVPALFHYTGGLEVGLRGVNAYPTDTTSASPTTLLEADGISMTVERLNGGGTMGTMIRQGAALDVRSLNYEPDPVVGSGHTVVDLTDSKPTHLSNVTITTGDIDSVYRLRDGAGNARLPQPHLRSGISAGPADIGVIDGALDGARPAFYYGREADWRGDSPEFFAFDTGGRGDAVGPITSSYTATHGETVYADTAGGSVTVTLPSVGRGKHVRVVHIDSATGNDLTIDGGGAQVNESASISIGSQFEGRDISCDGSDWTAY
jgi:hypothetical protein